MWNQFLALATVWTGNILLFRSPSNCSVDFGSFQNQHSPSKLLFWLYSCPTSILYYKLFCYFIPYYVSPTTTLLVQLASQFFYLRIFYKEQLVQALKHSELVHLLCRFHSPAHNPWPVIVVQNLRNQLIISCNFQCAIWKGFPKSSHHILLV